jgi:predicted AAA+ superfamily ATPase
MIDRILEKDIEHYLFRGRIVILFGPRRVGKTTLVRKVLTNHLDKQTAYFNCDLQSVQTGLAIQEAILLKSFLGEYDLVVLDEAQNIPDIGKILKILVDTYPEMQIIATGSSSFDLANRAGEPLTGRAYPLRLYPVSLQELAGKSGYSVIESRLDNLLRFGLYPSIIDLPERDAQIELQELVSSYLYKDVLMYIGVKRSKIVSDLLRLLALQVGNEVSYTELGTTLGIDRRTVMSYIDILEQSFVVFTLSGFSRNLRKEVGKTQKIYFYDVGVRNALLQAFSPLALRNDVGALWENFCIVERLKKANNTGLASNRYFWRTYDKKEIDYIEERDGVLSGFEFKWNPNRSMKVPQEFLATYPGSSIEQVDRGNYWRFLL